MAKLCNQTKRTAAKWQSCVTRPKEQQQSGTSL